MYTNPVVIRNNVYLADLGGSLKAYSLTNGAPLWQFQVPIQGNSFWGTPLYYGGSLYLGDIGFPGAPPSFYSIDAATGAVNWSYLQNIDPNFIGFQGSAQLVGGLLYQGEATGNEAPGACDTHNSLVAFNPKSGALVSALNISPAGDTGPDVWTTPVTDGAGNAFVATGNLCAGSITQWPTANAILKLQNSKPNLGVKWAFTSPYPANYDLDFGMSPMYINGALIDTGKDGYAYSLNPVSGALNWQTSIGGAQSSGATDGVRAYLPVSFYPGVNCQTGSPCGGIFALNLVDGSIAWSTVADADSTGVSALSAVAYSQGVVYADYNQTIWAFDALTGAVLWSYNTGQLEYGGITIVNKALIVGSIGTGEVYVFTPYGL